MSHINPNSESSNKISQRLLKAERDGYRAVFDLNPQPLLLCDVGTLRILAANQQAAKLHGVSPEQLIGISLFELRRVSDLTSVMLKRAAGREIALGFGYHTRKDGSTFPVQLSVHPSELAGRPVWLCVLKSLEEVLQPREGEQERRLSEAVGHLASGVAHDINNLLAVVLSFTSLATAQVEEGSSARSDLSEIRGAAERAAALTKQLLNLSRKAPEAPKPLQLNELLTRAEKLLRRLVDEQLTIELNLDPELDQVMADANQVERLLVQLVSEARHGSVKGSRLSIETRNVALELEHGKERHVMLAVNDSGGSLSPEVAAMSSFVEAASSWLECDAGSGARFVAWFPSLKVVRLAGNASERRKSRPETVLIVQDNPHLRKTLKTYFVRQGYGVIEADSSCEALRIVERDARIELLLTDFSLPDGNGADLTRALRQQLPELKSLITISHTEQRAAVREDSRTATLSKPFDLQPFGELVQRLLSATRELQP